MQFIRPTDITDSNLTSSSIPETDYAAWNAGTAYLVGDRVIYAATHRIYERVVAGTTATTPNLDLVNWLDIAPTNRWAMFDQTIGTVSEASDSMTIVLTPGRLNSLALLGVSASTAEVSLDVGGDIVYTASIDLDSGNQVGDWYAYFYEPIYQQTELVITNLVDAALLEIPAYSEGILTVTLTRTGGTVYCAMLVVGLVTDVGDTQFGAKVSIRDYSRKEADAFGNFTLVQRSYSKLLTADVVVPDTDVDRVVNVMTRYRATNLVWIGANAYGSLVVYGFAADWSLVIEAPSYSRFSIEIEGMT